jgi:hypothetical protein
MYKVTQERFIDWYFSDQEDFIHIGERVKLLMEKTGYATISVENIFWEQDELPTWILEGYDGDEDYIGADEVELIK